MRRFDVAVVGAGPAGACTAISLSGRGYKVALIDRAVFPRDKLCGDFLNPVSWPILQELNVGRDVLARRHSKVSSFRVTAADGSEAVSDWPRGEPLGLGMRRYDLDAVLVERAKKAAVAVREGSKVTGLERTSGGWELQIDHAGDRVALFAQLIVGADGRNSWVARRLGVLADGRTPPTSVGFETQLLNVRGLHGSVEIHQFPGGYAGLVRVDSDTVNLCFTMDRTRLRKPISFDALRDLYLNGNPFLRGLLAGGEPCGPLRSVSPVYFPPRKSFGDRFLLAGDAARVTEPVTGEGIYLALRSGQLAAETLNAAFRDGDFTAASLYRYDRACRHEFRHRWRFNSLIRVLARHPALLAALIRLAARRRRVLESMVSSVCAVSPRAKLNYW